MLTWLDVLAISVAALATVVGARRGGAYLVAFVTAAAAYAAAAWTLPSVGWLPVAALAGGGLGVWIGGRWRFAPQLDALLGGVGGFLWGAALAVSLWVAFPAEYSPASGAIRYPSARLPLTVQRAVAESPFAPRLFALVWNHPLARKLFLPGGSLEAR
ncbi:hypothetical protein [Marinithermus hydrothermalis]|uniref:Colicin V production protein n=1 Tax=Marinithermus hydrothermalis (strain DSM 14884 / JCM 11576 / T1) TaxID=869210 RepID=F2NPL6_MARHT|nr:hypothetical protein [Marinithermus hydrothermalis]AEB12517.1 hypothetical protein Marky_1784 [Marinithermus hydrothermalis DSM 14884]